MKWGWEKGSPSEYSIKKQKFFFGKTRFFWPCPNYRYADTPSEMVRFTWKMPISHCTKTNEKSIFRFLFFQLWSIVLTIYKCVHLNFIKILVFKIWTLKLNDFAIKKKSWSQNVRNVLKMIFSFRRLRSIYGRFCTQHS